eukprot:506144_1
MQSLIVSKRTIIQSFYHQVYSLFCIISLISMCKEFDQLMNALLALIIYPRWRPSIELAPLYQMDKPVVFHAFTVRTSSDLNKCVKFTLKHNQIRFECCNVFI